MKGLNLKDVWENKQKARNKTSKQKEKTMLNYVNEMLAEAKEELKALTCHIDKYGKRRPSRLGLYKLEKDHILSSGEIEKILEELEDINRKIELLQGLRSEKAHERISYLKDRRRKGEIALKATQDKLERLETAISEEHTKIEELKAFIAELERYNDQI